MPGLVSDSEGETVQTDVPWTLMPSHLVRRALRCLDHRDRARAAGVSRGWSRVR